MPALVANQRSSATYTGAAEIYTVSVSGTLIARLWGGAGGGSRHNNGQESGAGGFNAFSIPVVAGDEIKVEVAQGGRPGAANTGGLGGWPDGGNGGLYSSAQALGGGGGSTRLYVNNVLRAIAGGGGSAGFNFSGSSGGGTLGGNGESNALAVGGTGGTQTAGGTNSAEPNDTSLRGASLKGGNGYLTGSSPTVVAGVAGPGGGGGYFGGAGGYRGAGAGATASGGGGGGSGLIPAGGTSPNGARTLSPQGTSEPGYISGVGLGKISSTTAPAAGGDGLALMTVLAAQAFPENTKIAASYAGIEQVYSVAADGVVDLKMWAGAGSGSYKTTTSLNDGYGGGSGFVSGRIKVVAGDQIKVEVGQGGQAPASTSAPTAGPGGYPDGGQGSHDSVQRYCGSGGGSSRVYLNDVLIAICGAGGGQRVHATTLESTVAGRGGGRLSGIGVGSQPGYPASWDGGGTQLARPNDTVSAGGFLRGGHGWPTGSDATTSLSQTGGPGGGGGYYGGGGGIGTNNTNFSSAAGGSSWADNSTVFDFVNEQAPSQLPPRTTDVDYVTGIGVGSRSTNNSVLNASGGNGRVILNHTSGNPNTLIASPLTASVRKSVSVSRQVFVMPSNGSLLVSMWGGASGRGAYGDLSTGTGGAGGYTTCAISVLAGDLIEVRAGYAGSAGSSTVTRGGGAQGGWPDGGSSGARSTTISYGSGGGSSCIYRNGVLVAVAGAGGASGSQGPAGGGPGGGSAGVDSATGGFGTGGTPTAGGTNTGVPTDANLSGSAVRGGIGRTVGITIDTLTPSAGPGGGGGYFGGGAGLGTSNSAGGAGGGSGYLHPTLTQNGLTQAGTRNTNSTVGLPPGTTDPNYVTGVASSPAPNATQVDRRGGDGLVSMELQPSQAAEADGNINQSLSFTPPTASVIAGSPGAASAEFTVPSLIVAAPEAGVRVGNPVAVFDTAIDFTAPTGSGVVSGEILGTFPELMWRAELGGGGTVEAVILVPLVDYDLVWSADLSPDASGGVLKGGSFGEPIRLVPPRALFMGVAPGDPFENDLTFTAPEAIGQEGVLTTPDIGTLLLSEPQADAGGFAVAAPLLSTDGAFSAFGFRPLLVAEVGSGDTVAQADLTGQIDLSAPEASAEDGIEAYADWTSAIMLVSDLEASVLGLATASGDIGRLNLIAPQAQVSAGANVMALEPGDAPFIQMMPPAAFTTYGATILTTILPARITLRAPNAIASDGEVVLAIAGGLEDVPLSFTALEGTGYLIPEGLIGEIRVREVDGYVEYGALDQAPLRFKRSLTEGQAPTTLSDGEIALNEADGVLFSRDFDGAVRPTPYGGLKGDGLASPDGAIDDILTAQRLWALVEPVFLRPVRLAPEPSDLVPLIDSPAGTGTVVPQAGQTYYRPFFLPKQVRIDRIGFDAVEASATYVEVTIVQWNLNGTPGDAVVSRAFGSAVSGFNGVPCDVVINPGWYAGSFSYLSGSARGFNGARSQIAYDNEMNPVGDFYGAFEEAGQPPVTPVARTTTAWGLVHARFA